MLCAPLLLRGQREVTQRRTFHASEYWRMNLSGGTLAGIGATILLLTAFGIGLWTSGFATEPLIWLIGICLNLVAMFFLFYPAIQGVGKTNSMPYFAPTASSFSISL